MPSASLISFKQSKLLSWLICFAVAGAATFLLYDAARPQVNMYWFGTILAIAMFATSLLPNFANNTRDNPMKTANIQGPKRSPSVLETFSPDSANADAHWLTAISVLPAQSIRSTKNQTLRVFASAEIFMPSPSATGEKMGTKQK